MDNITLHLELCIPDKDMEVVSDDTLLCSIPIDGIVKTRYANGHAFVRRITSGLFMVFFEHTDQQNLYVKMSLVHPSEHDACVGDVVI